MRCGKEASARVTFDGVERTVPDVSDQPLDRLISLDGRAAVVTGGARNIGLAIACRLAEAGARVVIADADGPEAELGAEYWVIVHRDLRRAACVRAVIDWIRQLFVDHRDELAGAEAALPKAAAAE